MKTTVGLLGALLVAGCATGGAKEGGAVATFVHPATKGSPLGRRKVITSATLPKLVMCRRSAEAGRSHWRSGG